MNNRGFGIIWLLGFIILIAGAFLTVYIFITKFITPLIWNNNTIQPNYRNEYIIYMREHNIKMSK